MFSVCVLYFFSFTAEDAYITYRYAENLVTTGTLTFNNHEPINALTSPLHALFSSALFYTTGHTVLANDLVGLAALTGSAFLVWRRFKNHPELQILASSLILLPAPVMVWTFGGLETPFLLFIATAAVILVDRYSSSTISLKSICLITTVAGLGFLTRYDSALFFAPIVLFAILKARSRSHVLIALATGALLPALWLAISISYYGDVFPTSFYEKTPTVKFTVLLVNGIYIALYLFFCGIIPAMAFAFWLLKIGNGSLRALIKKTSSMWWLYVAISLQLIYGLTMATTHMMFSFRYFVPYIPSAVFMVAVLLRQVSQESKSLNSKKGMAIFNGFMLCLLLSQYLWAAYTYNHSLNLIGEYQKFSVRDYKLFMDGLRKQSVEVSQHWDANGTDNRLPRILTYAAGVFPYYFRESYIYGSLISYRHAKYRIDSKNFVLSSDYVLILAPKHGSVESQLWTLENYSLVSSFEMNFDGQKENFLAYFNPYPRPHRLSTRINGSS